MNAYAVFSYDTNQQQYLCDYIVADCMVDAKATVCGKREYLMGLAAYDAICLGSANSDQSPPRRNGRANCRILGFE